MIERALQLIAENNRTRTTFLDLGNCGLTEIPAEVGELVWLESLSVADEWHEWDGREWQYKHSRNNGDSNQALTDIRPLAGLSALQSLFLRGTQITDLAPLAGLSALQTLNLYGAQVCDLGPLAGLSALQTLDIRYTKVSDLGPLAGLSALQTLDIRYTKITDLGPLASLTSLHNLDVQG